MAERTTRWLAPVCATAALSLLLASGAQALQVGEEAPQFAARDLSGEGTLSLQKFRGKVVYLDFWASWCKPCMKSLPLLDELHREFGGQGFQVLAINVDKDVERAREFLQTHPVSYPSASDPRGHLPEVFEIPTMPTSFLIDREGVIRYVHPGFRAGDMEELRMQIRQLIESGK